MLVFQEVILDEEVRESAALVAPQGFEPRYAAPEAAVLPLNEGAMQAEHAVQRAFMDDKCSRACGQTYVCLSLC